MSAKPRQWKKIALRALVAALVLASVGVTILWVVLSPRLRELSLSLQIRNEGELRRLRGTARKELSTIGFRGFSVLTSTDYFVPLVPSRDLAAGLKFVPLPATRLVEKTSATTFSNSQSGGFNVTLRASSDVGTVAVLAGPKSHTLRLGDSTSLETMLVAAELGPVGLSRAAPANLADTCSDWAVLASSMRATIEDVSVSPTPTYQLDYYEGGAWIGTFAAWLSKPAAVEASTLPPTSPPMSVRIKRGRF